MSEPILTTRWCWLRQHVKKLRTAKPEAEDEGTIWRFVGVIMAAVPVLTAATYLLGMAYHYGYTMAFRLDYSEFSLPADYLLAFGLMKTLDMLKPWMWPLLGLIISIFSICAVLIFCPRWRIRLTWWWQTSWLYRAACKQAKAQKRYPAPSLSRAFIWLGDNYYKFAFLLLAVLIPVMGAIDFFIQGVKAAQVQITLLEQGNWPESEANSQSPLLGNEPHIRITCNTIHCAYRFKGGDTLLLRHDQIEQTRYRPEPPPQDETKPSEMPTHP
ncbi:hypothetical protein [Aeromonas sp. FDAARGOS 1409]|uniref:hypothetical protein n=1 Tax=Aeromonas TaxID=642 RepID=UPI0020B37005|nr:hypothetical protein [Aeromonas sp. FDAARGOS 1409]